MIPATKGRIVYYHEGNIIWPAMIVSVHSDHLVDLKVFTDDSVYSRPRTQLLQDAAKPSEPHWAEWMPYQVGQAAKSEQSTDDLRKNLADIQGHLKTLEDRFASHDVIGRLQAIEQKLIPSADAGKPAVKK